jgi:hypothetical protein
MQITIVSSSITSLGAATSNLTQASTQVSAVPATTTSILPLAIVAMVGVAVVGSIYAVVKKRKKTQPAIENALVMRILTFLPKNT